MAAKVNEPLSVRVIEEIAKRFGIRHLSHSSLDLYRSESALWTMRYLCKVYEGTNAAMERGKAVEHGCYLAHPNVGSEFDHPIDEAVREFNKATALGVNGEARDRERENVAPMVQQYIDLFDGKLPELDGFQRRIEIEIPGCPIPLMGYTDFDFEDVIVDLKTTTRLPSAISSAHRRQGAIYSRASGNRGVDVIYVTPKKSARYRLDDTTQEWAEICGTAHALFRFLSNFENREEVAAVLAPNYDHFFWSSTLREKAREVFGY